MFSTKRKDSFSHGESPTPQGNTQACSLGVNTTDGTFYSQSATTSETSEDVLKLSSKTSLTPSDAHKVVIEVSDSDAENTKGNSFIQKFITLLYIIGKCQYF